MACARLSTARPYVRTRRQPQRRPGDQSATPGAGAAWFAAAHAQILEPERDTRWLRASGAHGHGPTCVCFPSVTIHGQREMPAVCAHRRSRGYARVRGRRLDDMPRYTYYYWVSAYSREHLGSAKRLATLAAGSSEHGDARLLSGAAVVFAVAHLSHAVETLLVDAGGDIE